MKKYFKWGKFFITVFFIPIILQSSCIQINRNITTKLFVKSVYDGDTFYDNKNNSYRIIGINTPEIIINDYSFLRKKYALLAKDFLERNILRKTIEILPWKKDYYKRTLVVVLKDKEDIGLLLLRYGLARIEYISNDKKNYFYYPNHLYFKRLIKEEIYAKNNKKYIWKERNEKEIFSRN